MSEHDQVDKARKPSHKDIGLNNTSGDSADGISQYAYRYLDNRKMTPETVIYLQRTLGNHAVQRLLSGTTHDTIQRMLPADKPTDNTTLILSKKLQDAIDCIAKELDAEGRKAILHSKEDMERIRQQFGNDAPTIMASLLEGNPDYNWRAPQLDMQEYNSPFKTTMQQQGEDILPLTDTTVLCFENVLNAAYLGGILTKEQVLAIVNEANPQGTSNMRKKKDAENMPRLWARLGYNSQNPKGYWDSQKQANENIEQLTLESIAPGTILFLGPRDFSKSPNIAFENAVPYHVAIGLGGDNMIGIPGSGGNLQTKEKISDHVQKSTNKVIMQGPHISELK